MSFSPIIVGAGLQAWSLLKSTLPQQRALHDRTPVVQAARDAFTEGIEKVSSADDLVNNRSILSVVLGAYGLSDDINNSYFIKKIMSDGIIAPDALSNRLSDQRYKDLAFDFDFSPELDNSSIDDGLKIRTLESYQKIAFEIAVGEFDSDMRLSLGFQAGLERISTRSSSNNIAWYQILATPPVREVLLDALNLPAQFLNLDIDDQHKRIVEKAELVFGTSDVGELANGKSADSIVRKFLIRRQLVDSQSISSQQVAIMLLSRGVQRIISE